MPDDTARLNCVSNDEFDRWMRLESDFRTRLERRLETNAQAVQVGLGKIETHLAEINGRTRTNTEAIAVLRRDLDAIIAEDTEIERVVHSIQEDGCKQMKSHADIAQQLGWTKQKKATVAGGLIGIGALAWPAVQEIAAAVHAVMDWLGK